MDLNKLNSVITQFGDDFIQSMKNELEENGSVATGDLIDSVRWEFRVQVDEIIIQFLSNDYGKYVEQGRLAGTFPPVSQIQQWCEIKGIPIKDSFPIAKHIYTFGIKPKPFLFNDFDNKRRAFVAALMVLYGKEVFIEVNEEFKKIPSQVGI